MRCCRAGFIASTTSAWSQDLLGELQRLLEYCQLPFEDQCLRFYETGRVVQTAERRTGTPTGLCGRVWINGAISEPWLGPMKEALGNLVERYPKA